jgi:1-deoxy-D-xylulose-5-phosphate synthase
MAKKKKIIDSIHTPRDLKALSFEELQLLANEIRTFIIETVSETGGHLATNLGFVEATIALHYVLDSPTDKIVWDVGHQAYTHKILTGRKERMATIRQTHGLSGFPNKSESEHDFFNVGHASTSISQALGLALARDLKGEKGHVVAVCGDGSLTGGLCFEGLNNAGHSNAPMTVILNDNKMAISKSIGAMSRYLNKIMTNPLYNRIRHEIEKTLKPFPSLRSFLKHTEEGLKNLIVPGMVFEELGLRYFGPIDGHDIPLMIETLRNVMQFKEPCLLHLITKKGKGYEFAEAQSDKFHSAPPFNIATGEKTATRAGDGAQSISYTDAFSRALLDLAAHDKDIVAITAAMPDGTGLTPFQERFPKRFFDVGIAESHAVTFAGALASRGLKPVCAIYSTFLQRAYDQLIHDVALQGANVTFCLDRAGVVGPDGPTHHGLFDYAFFRSVPGSVISSPCNEEEFRMMLSLGVSYNGPVSIRYPKTEIPKSLSRLTQSGLFKIGEGECLREGNDVLILSIGSMLETALELGDELATHGISATICNMRYVKPLDKKLLLKWVHSIKHVVTIEEHIHSGGFGSAVIETLNEEKITDVRVTVCALPDYFIEHGSREYLFDTYGLTSKKIAQSLLKEFQKCKK